MRLSEDCRTVLTERQRATNEPVVMTKMRRVQRVETPVMFLAVKDNSDEIGRSWDLLESKLRSLRNRRFFGAFDDSGVYRCSVQIREGDDASRVGLEPGVIPGGLFSVLHGGSRRMACRSHT